MATVKVQWKAWTPGTISAHPTDQSVIHTPGGTPFGESTTSLPASWAEAPNSGPLYDGHTTEFMFWSGWGTDEPRPLGQIYTTNPNINAAFPPAVVFPPGTDNAAVFAWYRSGEDVPQPANRVYFDVFNEAWAFFLDWDPLGRVNPISVDASDDHGPGWASTVGGAGLAANGAVWPPGLPAPLHFDTWLVFRSDGDPFYSAERYLTVPSGAAWTAFALYEGWNPAPATAPTPWQEYPWPIPIRRPGDPWQPSELTKEVARLTYIHDLAAELSAPAKSAIQGETLAHIAEVAKLHAGATEQRPKQTRKSARKQ